MGYVGHSECVCRKAEYIKEINTVILEAGKFVSLLSITNKAQDTCFQEYLANTNRVPALLNRVTSVK